MSAVARRGERPMGLDEFKLHLAQAVSLEHVGTLLGAGASVACGGQTIAGLWDEFQRDESAAHSLLVRQRFLGMPGLSPVNIEALIDDVTIALKDAKRRGENTDALRSTRAALLRAVLRAARLDDGWLGDPSSAAGDDRLSHHVRLLTRLAYSRQPGQPAPWVFTTNYDMAIELAAENASLHVRDGFRGFHHRLFTPSAFDLGLRNAEARGEAQFGTYEIYLAKLHGSLS